MLKIIVVILLVLVVGVILFIFTRPDTFHVERSANIHAPPEKIFSLINDFHRWESWSPWEKIDPEVKRKYSGAPSGTGAIYEWSGNKELGQGRIEIIESSPPTMIVMKIDFIAPIEAHNKLEFTLTAQGGTTMLTQSMSGPSNFISKGMHLFFNMDKMIGEKYQQGFANIKMLVEK